MMLYFDEMSALRELLNQTSDPPSVKQVKTAKAPRIEKTQREKFFSMFLFEIRVQSPHIIIPQNSIASNMIHLCLGDISVHNKQINNNNENIPILLERIV